MESPGEYLKREREHRGKTLAAVHEATRIPMKYLAALEADDVDAQPHATFTKGFIKSYCKYLGLDENDAVLRYEMFLREKAEKPDIYRADDAGKAEEIWRKVDKKYVYAAVSVVVALVVVYAIFLRGGKKAVPPVANVASKAADTAAGPQVQEPQPQAGPIQTVGPQAQTVGPQTAGPQSQVQAKPLSGRAEQAKAVDARKPPSAKPEKAPAKEALKPAQSSVMALSAKAVPVEAQKADTDGGREKKHVVSVTASELVWIKVGIDARPAFNVILKAGESASWRAVEGFHLVVGNAGGVTMNFDGKTLGSLGPSGKVVNVNLPEGFTQTVPATAPLKPQ